MRDQGRGTSWDPVAGGEFVGLAPATLSLTGGTEGFGRNLDWVLTRGDAFCIVTCMNNTTTDPYEYDSHREDDLLLGLLATEEPPEPEVDFDAYVATFEEAYIDCAAWVNEGRSLDAETDEEAEWWDSCLEDAVDAISSDCLAFCKAQWDDLKALDPEQSGHDFYLTRNGHGTGFWDRGYGGVGDRLTEASKLCGESDY